MASYRVVFRKSVKKDLAKIPKKDVQKIIKAIGALSEEPRPPQARKLSGQEYYRLRQGSYRILYSIEDEVLVVAVVKVRHRRDVYKNKPGRL